MKERIIGIIFVLLVLGALAYLTESSDNTTAGPAISSTPTDSGFKDLNIN